MRRLQVLVLALALVAGQWMGQLHALGHAKHELALAEWSHGEAFGHGLLHEADAHDGAGSDAPALDHATDQCVAFMAIGVAAVCTPPLADALGPPAEVLTQRSWRFVAVDRVPFFSHAPPVFHS